MSTTILKCGTDDEYLTIDDSGTKVLEAPDEGGAAAGDYIVTVDVGGEGPVIEDDGGTIYVHFVTVT